MGFGLISGPVLSILLGPIQGITITNLFSMINAANNTAALRKEVQWSMYKPLAGFLFLGMIPALILIQLLPASILMIAVGLIILLALSVSTFKADAVIISTAARGPKIVASAIAGVFSVVTSVIGPVYAIYAQMARWKDARATFHPLILTASASSFLLKTLLFGRSLHFGLPWWAWIGALASMFFGSWCGQKLSSKINATSFALILAGVSAISVIVRGISQL